MSKPANIKAGAFLGPYKVIGTLGEGGLGIVYLVEDTDHEQRALKTLKMGGDDTETIGRFIREMSIAMKLKHPAIVETFDIGVARSGAFYLLCEYCPNGDLLNFMRRRGPLAPDVAMGWMAAIADAMEYADHEFQMIHRDIKPHNILLDKDNNAKLADLGLACRIAAGAIRMTTESIVLGSGYYMSPEQARSALGLDIRTDIYALGATFYHLLAGAPMFEGKDIFALIEKQIHDEPKQIRDLRPDVPVAFAELLHAMIAKDRNHRPGRALTVAEHVREIAARAGMKLMPPPVSQDSKTPPYDRSAVVSKARSGIAPAPTDTAATRIIEKESAVLPDAPTVDMSGLAIPAKQTSGPSAALALPRKGKAGSRVFRCLPARGPAWLGAAWVDMREGETGLSWSLVLYAKWPVVFGRLMGEGADLPLFAYPIEDHRDLCMKVSTRHGQFDRASHVWSVMDLNSSNGTMVNGKKLAPKATCPLPKEADVSVSSAVALRAVPLTRTLSPRIEIDGVGVETEASPALIVYRKKNLPELAYALIADRLPVGGDHPAAGFAPPARAMKECGAFWRFRDRFWWQPAAAMDICGMKAGPGDLAPLASGAEWKAGGLSFAIQPVTEALFEKGPQAPARRGDHA
jgi:serine/threonine protein kinase